MFQEDDALLSSQQTLHEHGYESEEGLESVSVTLEKPKTIFWWILGATLLFAVRKLRGK